MHVCAVLLNIAPIWVFVGKYGLEIMCFDRNSCLCLSSTNLYRTPRTSAFSVSWCWIINGVYFCKNWAVGCFQQAGTLLESLTPYRPPLAGPHRGGLVSLLPCFPQKKTKVFDTITVGRIKSCISNGLWYFFGGASFGFLSGLIPLTTMVKKCNNTRPRKK